MNGPNRLAAARILEGAILIIDDDPAIRNGLAHIFDSGEAIVYTAGNGQDGLWIMEQRPDICLVLLDMNMPVMTGEETYAKLRQIAPQVKVIVSSSLSPAEARLRFGERTLPTYLQKPYHIDALLDVVQMVLATR